VSADSPADLDEARAAVATACRILARRGLVDGILGHVSLRLGDEVLIRCRGPRERGLALTSSEDIRRMSMSGELLEAEAGWSVPNEYPIHTVLLARRPAMMAVVHAHPRSALLAGLGGLTPRPVFGAFNIPAMRLALDGIPVYGRAVLIRRLDLAEEMLAAMGDRPVCILRGHGITVTGATLPSAVVTAINLEQLLSITVELARLGAAPELLAQADIDELPDLGGGFNDQMTWQALVAEDEAGIR
jgi:ribulose-5-phosphate 4-epimerase/fuculose-1-phosphate aldolase